MTVPEKMEVMERVWASLRENDKTLASPAWHKGVLAARKKSQANGDDRFSEWAEAKDRIRSQARAR